MSIDSFSAVTHIIPSARIHLKPPGRDILVAMLPEQTREQDLAHNQKFDGSVVGVLHVVDQKLYRRVAPTYYGSIFTGFGGLAHNTI